MKTELELCLPPDRAADKSLWERELKRKLSWKGGGSFLAVPRRRSIDARRGSATVRILFDVYMNERPEPLPIPEYRHVEKARPVLIAGFGPAGMFAALKLLELGLKPVVFERGKAVDLRKGDIEVIHASGFVNGESNYCFGEGGAGTYSDGKLYTRSTKRGDIGKILSILVGHGASEDILVDAHPHIGSDVLPQIVKSIRTTILEHGGEIHFESKITDIVMRDGEFAEVIVNESREYGGKALILATGHSARDIYSMLHRNSLALERKPFAVGVRIEHPQALIDEIQYKTPARGPYLPAARYSLTCNAEGRGVFSFCMCPGGYVIPASTHNEELVLNGMSPAGRDNTFANAGIVVTVGEAELGGEGGTDVCAGLRFQEGIENRCCSAAGGGQIAPAQLMTDFLSGKVSTCLRPSSYTPGIAALPVHELLPESIVEPLRRGFILFGKRMRGFLTEEALILAPETRTSSPLRIPRNRQTYMHEGMAGLFPCGEGAGYSGGIMSSAIDGENCATAAAAWLGV